MPAVPAPHANGFSQSSVVPPRLACHHPAGRDPIPPAGAAQAPIATPEPGSDGSDPVREVAIPVGPHPDGAVLRGTLRWPENPKGAVAFANGGGSGRNSPRDRYLAGELTKTGFATLLLDLLTEEEAEGGGVVDAGLLADRVEGAVDWLLTEPVVIGLPVGLFGSGSGAAAALTAAARRPGAVFAVVCQDGRPESAWDDLVNVIAPTLLIVGGEDGPGLVWNRSAWDRLPGPKRLAVVPGASPRFGEPGALARAAGLARDWLARHLPASGAGERPFEGNGRK